MRSAFSKRGFVLGGSVLGALLLVVTTWQWLGMADVLHMHGDSRVYGDHKPQELMIERSFSALQTASGVTAQSTLASPASRGRTPEETPLSAPALRAGPTSRGGSGSCGIVRQGAPDIRTVKKIRFFHLRKAGGTSVKYHIHKIAKYLNISFEVLEGKPAAFKDIFMERDNETLYISHLRDPVKRVWSSFDYDGRIMCSKMSKKRLGPLLVSPNSTIRTCTVREWAHRHRRGLANARSCTNAFYPEGCNVWWCVVNCETRWLGGLAAWGSKQFRDDHNPARLERAKRVIDELDVLVIIERITPKCLGELSAYFGVPDRFNKMVYKPSFAAKRMKIFKKNHPYEVTDADKQLVIDMTDQDRELYRYAVASRGN